MRVILWNCKMRFRDDLEKAFKLNPDIFENDTEFKISGEKDRKNGNIGHKYMFNNKEYYDTSKPLVTDKEYDDLKNKYYINLLIF